MKYRTVPNIGDLLFLPTDIIYVLAANNQMQNCWVGGPLHFLVIDNYLTEYLQIKALVVFCLEKQQVVKILQEDFVKLKVVNETELENR